MHNAACQQHRLPSIIDTEERGDVVRAHSLRQGLIGRSGIITQQLAAVADEVAVLRSAEGDLFHAEDAGNDGGNDVGIG